MRPARHRAARLLRWYRGPGGSLGRRPVRIASGHDDPFYPGVQALARALPAGAVVAFGPGCHDGSFFVAQEPLAGLPG